MTLLGCSAQNVWLLSAAAMHPTCPTAMLGSSPHLINYMYILILILITSYLLGKTNLCKP